MAHQFLPLQTLRLPGYSGRFTYVASAARFEVFGPLFVYAPGVFSKGDGD